MRNALTNATPRQLTARAFFLQALREYGALPETLSAADQRFITAQNQLHDTWRWVCLSYRPEPPSDSPDLLDIDNLTSEPNGITTTLDADDHLPVNTNRAGPSAYRIDVATPPLFEDLLKQLDDTTAIPLPSARCHAAA